MTLGEQIIALRQARRWGRGRLATEAGMALSHLQAVEKNRVIPGPEVLDHIGDALALDSTERATLRHLHAKASLARIGVASEAAAQIKQLREELDAEEFARLDAELVAFLDERRRAK